ncbi:MAG: membrane protein (DUF95) [halophilic archaeon J07HB67]|nr:MAG: membrane protein (DUF95) [halophilic archaeon J07HB67]
MRGAGRWRTFAGLFSLKLLVGVVFVGGPVLLVSASGGQVGVALLGVLLAVVGVVATLLSLGLLAFAGPAIVVDDRGVFGAVRASLGMFRHHLGTAVGFVALVAALYVGALVAAGLLGAGGAGRVGALLTPLFVAPFTDVLATGVYAGVQTEPGTPTGTTVDEPTPEPDERGVELTGTATGRAASAGSTDTTLTVPVRSRNGVGERLRQAFGGGLRAFAEFALATPGAVAAILVVFGLGAVGGWSLTAPAGVAVPAPSDVGNVFGTLPVNDFVNIAANNWLVAASGVYSGLAFGVPAAVGAAFNGALVGALAGVFEPRVILALVAPHGVIEIPVLAVTWGLGLHLAGVGWRAVRGQTDAPTVATRLREAAHVLGGAAVLLVVAALVEAFVTPEIAALVL